MGGGGCAKSYTPSQKGFGGVDIEFGQRGGGLDPALGLSDILADSGNRKEVARHYYPHSVVQCGATLSLGFKY